MIFLIDIYNNIATPIRGLLRVFLNPIIFGIMATFSLIIEAVHKQWDLNHIIRWELFTGVVILLLIDTILGVWKHLRACTFSSKGFSSLLSKVIIYWAFFKMADVVARVNLLQWTGDLMVSGLLIREAISIVENMAILRPELIPSWVLKRLKGFDEDGKFDKK